VSSWAKVVWWIVIAAIVLIVVAPDVDLQPIVSRGSRAAQKLGRVALHSIMPVVLTFSSLTFSTLPLRTAPHAKGDSFADLIDLKCSRLC
jgi:hypothetical protein